MVAGAVIYGLRPGPSTVETATAIRGHMSVTVDEKGKTRVIDRYVVSAPVAGFAQRIGLDVGDIVSKGDAIVLLEPLRARALDARSEAEARAVISSAVSALKAAKENALSAAADHDYAASAFKRTTILFKDGHVTEDTLDASRREAEATRARLKSAEFSVDVARHEVEAAKTALKYSGDNGKNESDAITVKSPVAGRVLRLARESEGVVTEGDPLIEIGDPTGLEVEVEVLSADAVKIRPGAKVLFTRWGGEGKLEGRVRVIEPTGFTKVSALGVEEQRVLVITDISSPREKWARLGDGYRVEAAFIIWEGDEILTVPAGALFRNGGQGWALFKVAGKTARLTPVKIGHRSGLTAEILDGVTEGDTIINHPDDSIEDGTEVKFR